MAVCLSILPWVSQAEVPKTISYQGYLFDEVAKKPIDNATVKLTFSLNGTSWTQTREVPVNQGVFAIPLDFSGLDFSKLDPNAITLSVEANVDGQIITPPPTSLSSVPYAFHAQTVDEATLGKLECSEGQVPAWNATTAEWFCSNNIPGPKGDKGDKGDRGPKGDTGPAFSGSKIKVGKICFEPQILYFCARKVAGGAIEKKTWFQDFSDCQTKETKYVLAESKCD